MSIEFSAEGEQELHFTVPVTPYEAPHSAYKRRIERITPPPFGRSYPKPDFVIFGMPADGYDEGSVILAASKELNQAELKSEVEQSELADCLGGICFGYKSRTPHRKNTLFVEMANYVMVIAPSYPEALQYLMETWSVPGPSQPELPAGESSD